MKILCTGFWKTGTKSLAQALRILGYKVYDYDDQFFAFPELWTAFLDGTVTDDQIYEALKDVDVLIDGPVIGYWEEIYKVFPDVKVILSTRDEDGWFKSYQGMCKDVPRYTLLMILLMLLTPAGWRFLRNGVALPRICIGVEGFMRIPMLTCVPTNARLYKLQFRKHNAHVIHTVPGEKLLIHKTGTGWGELCEFLGKEKPDMEYPHKNKLGAHFKTEEGGQHPELLKLQRQSLIVLTILVGLVAYLIYRACF